MSQENKPIEIWKDIPEYEGKYQASNTGLIRSLLFKNRSGTLVRDEPLILKQVKGPKKYMRVQLSMNNKTATLLVHRLVLMSFIGSCPDKFQCAHLDGNPENNNVSNLKWTTASENILMKNIHGTAGKKNKCKIK